MQQKSRQRPKHLPAGYDEEDPYEGENLSQYPAWWRELVEEFREHNLRPYRPPQFTDGVVTPEFVSKLESELSVEIQFKTTNIEDSEWGVYVEGENVCSIPRKRTGGGFTLYQITSTEFAENIYATVE